MKGGNSGGVKEVKDPSIVKTDKNNFFLCTVGHDAYFDGLDLSKMGLGGY